MKNLILILLCLIGLTGLAQSNDNYEEYLKAAEGELERAGMRLNVNTPNPFITGTALNNYYLNEKILLLERDAFLMMKSNKLETTEEIADYQHRLKVITSHANNMLIHMVRALKNAKEEGFMRIEAPKHQLGWEELLEVCKKSPECVQKKLNSGEVVLQNEILESFALSTQIFKSIPHMHAVEFAGVFQLVQLLYMESLAGHARLQRVEFDIFLKKQKELIRQIDENKQMTAHEKKVNRTMITNTVNRWKKRILERKFDQKEDYTKLARKLKAQNLDIIKGLEEKRAKNPEIIPEEELCRRFFKRDRRCSLRLKLEEHITDIKEGKDTFLSEREKKLPKDFFDTI